MCQKINFQEFKFSCEMGENSLCIKRGTFKACVWSPLWMSTPLGLLLLLGLDLLFHKSQNFQFPLRSSFLLEHVSFLELSLNSNLGHTRKEIFLKTWKPASNNQVGPPSWVCLGIHAQRWVWSLLIIIFFFLFSSQFFSNVWVPFM